jgi:hypothetical protein
VWQKISFLTNRLQQKAKKLWSGRKCTDVNGRVGFYLEGVEVQDFHAVAEVRVELPPPGLCALAGRVPHHVHPARVRNRQGGPLSAMRARRQSHTTRIYYGNHCGSIRLDRPRARRGQYLVVVRAGDLRLVAQPGTEHV